MLYLCVVYPAFVSFRSFTYTSEAGPGSLLARRIQRQQRSAQCRIDVTQTDRDRDRQTNKGNRKTEETEGGTKDRQKKTRPDQTRQSKVHNNGTHHARQPSIQNQSKQKTQLKLSSPLSCLTLSLCLALCLVVSCICPLLPRLCFCLCLPLSFSSLLAY